MIALYAGGGILALASSITFCFRMLAGTSRMTDAMVVVAANLAELKDRHEADVKDRARQDLERDKVWGEIQRGTERLIEMHNNADRFGFGTRGAMEAIAESQKTLVALTQNIERLGNGVMQMQETQRWIIENTDSIKGKLPPSMPGQVPGFRG